MHVPRTNPHPLDRVWGNQTPSKNKALERALPESAAVPPELLTEKQAAALLGVGVRKFHALRSEPWFPQAVELGPRALRWVRAELMAVLIERAPRRTLQSEPEQFQQARAKRGRV